MIRQIRILHFTKRCPVGDKKKPGAAKTAPDPVKEETGVSNLFLGNSFFSSRSRFLAGNTGSFHNLGGVLDQTIHELAIICQVKDLPEAITADISGLKLGESLRITDLKLPSGVTTELAGDVIVAIVEAPRVSGEEAAPAAEEAVAEK